MSVLDQRWLARKKFETFTSCRVLFSTSSKETPDNELSETQIREQTEIRQEHETALAPFLEEFRHCS